MWSIKIQKTIDFKKGLNTPKLVLAIFLKVHKNKPVFVQSNGGGAPDQVQKLKSTVLQLESTLSKRNKEIASLKKQTGESGGKKQVG